MEIVSPPTENDPSQYREGSEAASRVLLVPAVEAPPVEISPNRLYRARELEELLGRRCVSALRQHGLRAVGDWYLGQTVLAAFGHAAARR